MAFKKTRTVKIQVGTKTATSGQCWDSLDDFGLAIQNTDYIGQPIPGTGNTISVPGRDGLIDFTDNVFGGQYFTHREIKIEFGGQQDIEDWDSVISMFRNRFEGKMCRVIFDNLPDFFFLGRVEIRKFSRVRSIGGFIFCMPYADPCMYTNMKNIHNVPEGTTATYTVPVTRGFTHPIVTCTETITLQLKNGGTVVNQLTQQGAGRYNLTGWTMTPTINRFTANGGGTVTIEYLDGRL